MSRIIQHKNPELDMLLDLNYMIHHDNKKFDYHMKHIKLVKQYACIVNKMLNSPISNHKLSYIAYAHDLFKERSLDPNKPIIWRNITIPCDTTRYVRENLDVLERFELDDYFNSSLQYHALSSGLFLIKEFKISDNEILYPIMFHSCPIIEIYEKLNSKLQTMIDIIMLADKLSSNYLKINYLKRKVRIDLDQAVFGSNGNEFNYSLGLLLARILSQGKSQEEQTVLATQYYFNRLKKINPLIGNNINIKQIGENKLWPERKSQVLMKH